MKLKTYMKRKKLTLRAFAPRVGKRGISAQTLHNYVTGKRVPPLGTALDIVKATDGDVSLRELLDGKTEQAEEKDRVSA